MPAKILEKKALLPRKTFKDSGAQKQRAITFEVVVVGKTCRETFELVRFHGAGAGSDAGCGCGRVDAVYVREIYCPHSGVWSKQMFA